MRNILEKAHTLPAFCEFDVGTGSLITVKSFVEKLKQAYENLIGESNTVLNFGAIPYRDGEIMAVKVNNSDLVNLGWNPETSLERGLINLLKENK